MRALSISVTVICAIAGTAMAQPLPVAVKDGSAWTMTVEHAREQTSGGKTTSTRSRSTYSLRFKSGKTGGGQITMTLKDVPAAGISAEERRLDQTPLIFQVNDSLAPQRLVNEAQVRLLLEKALAATTREETPEIARAAKTVLDATFQSSIKQQLGLAALSQGRDLEVGKPLEYESSLPSPFGGVLVQAQTSFTLESYDGAAGRAIIGWRQTLDPASMRKAMKAVVETVGNELTTQPRVNLDDEVAQVSVERNDTCRHEIHIPTGLALKAFCTSVLKVRAKGEDSTRTDAWTITQTIPGTP